MLKKDQDGRLWDVDINGEAHSPRFGEEVMSELTDGMPLALKLTRGAMKGIANVTEVMKDKVLTEEERQALEEKRAVQAEKPKRDLGNGMFGDLINASREGDRGSENLRAIGKSLFHKAVNAVKKDDQ